MTFVGAAIDIASEALAPSEKLPAELGRVACPGIRPAWAKVAAERLDGRCDHLKTSREDVTTTHSKVRI